MKVKELIELLSKFDENLDVCVHCNEDTASLKQVRLESDENHCYDQGDHILECWNIGKCVMLSDEGFYKLDENGYILRNDDDEDDEDYEEEE